MRISDWSSDVCSSDLFGLRRAFLMAIVIFVGGTTACALAPAMPWLLAARTVQGLGGGLLLGLSYSAVRMVFDARLWSRAMVLVSSMWGDRKSTRLHSSH